MPATKYKNVSPNEFTLYLSYGVRKAKPGDVVETLEGRDSAIMERMSYKVGANTPCKGCGTTMSGTAPAFEETNENATVSPTIKQKQIAKENKAPCAPCEKKKREMLAKARAAEKAKANLQQQAAALVTQSE